jgi:hypothetical protein
MIGDGNDVKPFLGSFCDKFFGGVSYAVKRVFSGVKMQICLEGPWPFYFDHRFFNHLHLPTRIFLILTFYKMS